MTFQLGARLWPSAHYCYSMAGEVSEAAHGAMQKEGENPSTRHGDLGFLLAPTRWLRKLVKGKRSGALRRERG